MSRPDLGDDDPFGVATLPYGVVVLDGTPQCAVRIGDRALPLRAAAAEFDADLRAVVSAPSLDPLLAAGPAVWERVRSTLTALFTEPSRRADIERLLVDLGGTQVVLGWSVADYVDFYASQAHTENVGKIFRPDGDSLPVNWKSLPVGYHGRAGTVVVSGTPIQRPWGQQRVPGEPPSARFAPSDRLDFEAEVGFVVGGASVLGQPVGVHAFDRNVFGVVLLNDWSARDIQSWEYVPLGPFLGKSFATSVSAWITPLAALSAARVEHPPQEPAPLPYLDDTGDSWALDLRLQVRINGQVVSKPPYAGHYWTPAQMLAHLTSNGASLRPGDLYGSGTVSGWDATERGSLLELSWGGSRPVRVGPEERRFLQDGDEVVITATAPGPHGSTVGISEVRGRVRPALVPNQLPS